MEIGAVYREDGSCHFLLWAPETDVVELELVDTGRIIPMAADQSGYHRATLDLMGLPARYFFKFNDSRLPDPASRFQPEGVHGPSAVVNQHAYVWHDQAWEGLPIQDMVIYEVHVGAFTPEGTFSAIESRLDQLVATGINALELMPVGQFPGCRNWGYDQAYPYAVQNSYGGPQELKSLVDACHGRGIAVLLDVVYNHFGPEGVFIGRFGPYFTPHYRTPWGDAVNFDGEGSDEVRNFFIENALYWLRHFHIDGLRLDAVHAMYDFSAQPFLQELARAVARFSNETGRKRFVIAESDLNDSRLVSEPARGGFGLDAQWSDDFHHSLHSLLTGETRGYYSSFGGLHHFAKAYQNAFAYEGAYSPFRKRRFGSSTSGLAGRQFIVFTQNHDQTGNRMFGERLSRLVNFEQLKLAAAALILSPYVPLLFMGEEYAEEAPFLYFIDHGDPGLIEAVRRGRADEFPGFAEACPPPDPQSQDTFASSMIRWEFREHGRHGVLLNFYRELLGLRKGIECLRRLDRESLSVHIGEEAPGLMEIQRWHEACQVFLYFNFSDRAAQTRPVPPGKWRRIIDSAEMRWLGPGTATRHLVEQHSITIGPQSCAAFQREEGQ